MFKHILLPSGWVLRRRKSLLEKGMKFARSNGAQVTGLYVIQPFHLFSTGDEMLSDSKESFTSRIPGRTRGSSPLGYSERGEGERRHLQLHLRDVLCRSRTR